MSDTDITTVSVDEQGVFTLDANGERIPVEGETDWQRVEALTDEEIEQAIASDPDAFAPTPAQLANARLATWLVCCSRSSSTSRKRWNGPWLRWESARRA